ncbi:MAG: FMN-binding protein [Clostridia bacterium]|nr:FMN-binding protein [Clostridia bacterium]
MRKITNILFLIMIISFLATSCEQSRKDLSSKMQSSNPKSESAAPAAENKETQLKVIQPSNDRYKDGTYTGISEGKQPGLKVAVTVKDGRISSVKVDAHNETAGYSDEALKVIPERIVAKNSVEVDAVTRVTDTCEGIQRAVKKALKDAKLN